MENQANLVQARTCVYRTQYHIVWTVRYRKEVLTPEMEVFLLKAFKEIAEEKDFNILQASIDGPAIYLVVSGHPKIEPSYMVKMLKGISGRRLLIAFPELKDQVPKGQLWNSTFFLETIGTSSNDELNNYLKHQLTRG